MFPEHERCYRPQRWDTEFSTWEENQETQGGWVQALWPEQSTLDSNESEVEPCQPRVCSSHWGKGLLEGVAGSPVRQEDGKAKGGV